MKNATSMQNEFQGLPLSTKLAGIGVLGISAAAIAMIGIMAFGPAFFVEIFHEPAAIHSAALNDANGHFVTPTERSPAASTFESKQRLFISLIPMLKNARELRVALGDSAKLAIDKSLLDVSSGLDATEFADNVLGIESTYQQFQGGSTHRGWIKNKLESELIDTDDVYAMFRAYLSSLQAELLDLDRDLLRAAKHEQEYAPSHGMDVRSAIANLESATWRAVNEAESMSSYAPVEMVGSLVVSTIVGSLVQAAATGMGDKTMDGKPTRANQNLAGGAGFAASVASDYVTKEIVGSGRKLKAVVESNLRTGLASIRRNGADATKWTSQIDNYIRNEQESVEALMIASVGVSPEWANDKLR